MQIDEQRQVENFAIICPLKHIEDPDMLAFVANLIQDHDHLREKLLTEPDRRKRTEKLEAMRGHLNFKAKTATDYEMAELARSCGVQPIYAEQEQASRIIMPPSRIHEVKNLKKAPSLGDKPAKKPKLQGESHSYDSKRPKRPVVSRYSK